MFQSILLKNKYKMLYMMTFMIKHTSGLWLYVIFVHPPPKFESLHNDANFKSIYRRLHRMSWADAFHVLVVQTQMRVFFQQWLDRKEKLHSQ